MLGGMVQRDPWLEHYGTRRRDPLRPRRLRLALLLAGVLAVVAGALVFVASRTGGFSGSLFLFLRL